MLAKEDDDGMRSLFLNVIDTWMWVGLGWFNAWPAHPKP